MNQPIGIPHIICSTGFLNKDMQAITAANVELDVPVELRSADMGVSREGGEDS